MTKMRNKGMEGQYAPLSYALLKSPAWRSLSGNAVRLFLELHTRYHGTNNGSVRLSFEEASKALGIGKATVQRAFKELQAKGFLVLVNEGNWYNRRAHEWRITYKPGNEGGRRQTPTNDWRRWQPSKKTYRGSRSERDAPSVVPPQN
ncbi:helix-turn-helix domain-containing protein [Algicella marina]|uniref:Helix-turn-helix domain-containing protein n=1 Tax=Algicella marina TaxID=2683284 RepID=A0A6P1SZD2_9RHOB|nr:helix-turn-helix domain-containing protein [Algicella marina]QHQ34885.1 helix-turn-helix domain-containing protein [Algicella marina]